MTKFWEWVKNISAILGGIILIWFFRRDTSELPNSPQNQDDTLNENKTGIEDKIKDLEKESEDLQKQKENLQVDENWHKGK